MSFMEIADIFKIQGRGVVVVGKIIQGSFKINDTVKVRGNNIDMETIIIGFEVFGIMREAVENDNVGLLLKGLNDIEIKNGYFLVKE